MSMAVILDCVYIHLMLARKIQRAARWWELLLESRLTEVDALVQSVHSRSDMAVSWVLL